MSRPDIPFSLLALALGFGLARISLCAVAAARSLVLQRRAVPTAGLAVAASAAGMVLLSLSLAWPERTALPADMTVTLRLLVGAVLLGAGALVNGGCYLGSISYLGTGNLNFLFTLAGIALFARWNGAAIPAPASPTSGMPRSWTLGLGFATFAAVLLLAWRSARSGAAGRGFPLRGPWPWRRAAACCGVVAAILFAFDPGWSYGRALEALANAGSRPPRWHDELPALSLFTGVGASALLAGRFRLVRPQWVRSARCLAGGALMACGASRIPGGNDALLLWSIPGLTLHGLVAYALMLLTLIAAFAAGRAANLR